MRRSLPTFLCVALSTGLAACDQSVEGPSTDDEMALYNFRAAHIPAVPNYPGNGDLTMTRASSSSSSGGGGDVVFDFDLINNAVYRDDGSLVSVKTGDTLNGNDGSVCTFGTAGIFATLSAADGSIMYSALGPWVFDGEIEEALDVLNPPKPGAPKRKKKPTAEQADDEFWE